MRRNPCVKKLKKRLMAALVSILIGDLAFAFVKNKAIVNRCLTAVLAGAVRMARILGRADYGKIGSFHVEQS